MSHWQLATGSGCGHAAGLSTEVAPAAECEDCVREGSQWVHLRRCLACQHVACCDSSPRRHATGHWRATEHPVVASVEPGESWAWCYPDQSMFAPGD